MSTSEPTPEEEAAARAKEGMVIALMLTV